MNEPGDEAVGIEALALGVVTGQDAMTQHWLSYRLDILGGGMSATVQRGAGPGGGNQAGGSSWTCAPLDKSGRIISRFGGAGTGKAGDASGKIQDCVGDGNAPDQFLQLFQLGLVEQGAEGRGVRWRSAHDFGLFGIGWVTDTDHQQKTVELGFG